MPCSLDRPRRCRHDARRRLILRAVGVLFGRDGRWEDGFPRSHGPFVVRDHLWPFQPLFVAKGPKPCSRLVLQSLS